jgi:hypothetical protein
MTIHELLETFHSSCKILALIALEKSVAFLRNRSKDLRECDGEQAIVIRIDLNLETKHIETRSCDQKINDPLPDIILKRRPV